MHPDHHNKIIAISAAIVIAVVLVLGLAIIVYNRHQNDQTPGSETNEYQVIIQSTTADQESSIKDPAVQKLNQSTSASRSGPSGGREELIQATSQTN